MESLSNEILRGTLAGIGRVLTATLVLSAALTFAVAQAQGPASASSSAGESSAMQLQVLSKDQTAANQLSGPLVSHPSGENRSRKRRFANSA